LRLAELNDESTGSDAKRGKMDIVAYRGARTDRFGRACFVTSPEVSSDPIRLIRYDAAPGDPGRPLEKIGSVAGTFPRSEAATKGN
jgi:hypothetical protein